jgi:threonine dehydrogenase-like Zn-dependent dehydrogenase
MKAAVFHKPGDISYTTVADPRIELATDVILRVTSTAICGSDLHILSGAVYIGDSGPSVSLEGGPAVSVIPGQ